MATYSSSPVYYQVTWNNVSPTNYLALTGDQSGGMDPQTPWQQNRTVSITGSTAVTGTPMSDGETLLINGVQVTFAAADNLAAMITKINLLSAFHGVAADSSVAATYLTLRNAPGSEGSAFWVANADGSSACSKLGLTAGTYQYYPSDVGGAFSTPSAGANVTINGVNVVFSGGALATTVNELNNATIYTGVAAYAAGTRLQLASINGQPWVINSGNAVSSIGFSLGVDGGYPSTYADSLSRERANMRWQQTINELSLMANPLTFDHVARTGNIPNVSASTVTFTVSYQSLSQVTTTASPDEPDDGAILNGIDAVKRSVARAMVRSMAGNKDVFDPTTEAFGAYVDRPNPARIVRVTASALDTTANVTTVEDNIAVTQIPGV